MAKSRPGRGRPDQLADSQANPLQGPQVRHSGGPDSQRPGELDSDVLSQCMTQFILRIVNPVDQNRVAESVGRDLLRELPALSTGQAIISGAAANVPLLCRVRRRITEHGANLRHAAARWRTWFDKDQEGHRQRDEALPFEPSDRGRDKLFKT